MDSYAYLGVSSILIIAGLLGFYFFVAGKAVTLLRERKVRKAAKDVVEIAGSLYVKTPEALKTLMKKLSQDYDIKDCGKDKDYPSPGSWYASVREDVVVHKGKCGSCGSYIEVAGIQTHKHKCEVCGEYTFLEFMDGTVVRFKFIKGKRQDVIAPALKMKVYDYDDESRCLIFYAEPLDGNNFNDYKSAKAKEVLERNEDKFTRIQKDGKELIAIRYNPYTIYIEQDAVIDAYEISGHKVNFQTVKLYKGKEYGDFFDKLPIAESYMIDEAWRWAPLKRSPRLHEEIISAAGMVSDCGYYYQDGRTAFCNIHLERMRIFVEHFTEIDVGAWDKMICRADRSGPGMVRAIARFCHPEAEVTNRPNIFNAVIVLGKALEGQKPTEGEMAAAADALKDPKERDKFFF